jgi:cell division protein FtsA
MQTEEYVVAVDIGSSKICAVAGDEDQDTGKININAFAERTFIADENMIQNGKVNNLERVAEMLDSVLTEIAEQLSAPVQLINISISGGQIIGHSHTTTITRSDSDTIIQDDDMEDLLQDVRRTFEPRPGHTLLHILPQFFNVDKRTVSDDPVGHVGLRLGGAFYAITSPEANIRHLHEMIGFVPQKNENGKDSNKIIEVDYTLFSPIPDSLALLTKWDKDGVAVVNLGRDTTEVAIFSRQGIRHVAVIQYAGNKVTHDLMEAYNLRFEDAEMLKITCGSLPPDQLNENEVITISSDEEIPEFEVPVKGVLEIIELRIREIAAIVMSELVKSGFSEKLSQGIILTGGTANLYVVKGIFSETSNLHTRVGKPLKHVKRNPFSKLENPKYSTVIGLLLASYYPFDVRVPASVLHSDYISPQGKQKLNQSKPPKGGGMNGFINKIKDFMNSGNELGGDTYDRGR